MPVLPISIIVIISAILIIFFILIALQHFNKIRLNCLINIDYYISNNKILMVLYIFLTAFTICFFLFSLLTLYLILSL